MKNVWMFFFGLLFHTIIAHPQMEYSTVLGGSSFDYGHAIAVDSEGYVYVAGQANSPNYPTTDGAFDTTHNGRADIFVTKLNQNGDSLVYSTFIGGSGRDSTRSVWVDPSGGAYITGSTRSGDFPICNDATADSPPGNFFRLSPDGSRFQYTNCLTGGEKIVTDKNGNVIILGVTNSETFPVSAGAYDTSYGGDDDVFVMKIDISNNEILFSTFIGGKGSDFAVGIALDEEGSIYIAGCSNSEDFGRDAIRYTGYTYGKNNIFVAKLLADGSALDYLTIMGGKENDMPWGIAVNEKGQVYVGGITDSEDFYLSEKTFDSEYGGKSDGFLFKLNKSGSEVLYSSYIGGAAKDGIRGIVVNDEGQAFMTGHTGSSDFPVTSGAFDNSYNGSNGGANSWGDSFLMVVDTVKNQVKYATYLGGKGDEEAYGIAMDDSGDVYLCGVTGSLDFPTTAGAYDETINGQLNTYVMKFSF